MRSDSGAIANERTMSGVWTSQCREKMARTPVSVSGNRTPESLSIRARGSVSFVSTMRAAQRLDVIGFAIPMHG
jgi:hypothetical protein